MSESQTESGAFAYVQAWHERLQEAGWWHSFELPDGNTIEGVSSLAAQKMRLGQFGFPEDLTGKRVLDVGTWDGWFAFEMERRGAEVVAIDRWENPKFDEIHERLRSRVEYRQLSVYHLDPNIIGRFDIVLFMGVLYHLKHPLLALERVASVAEDMVAVESFTLRDHHRPGLGVEEHTLMEFYEIDEFGGQFDNWVAPTVPCLLAFCRSAGFARVELNNLHEFGAAVSCYRKWNPPALAAAQSIKLVAAFHADNHGLNFQSASSDEYVGCWVAAEGIVPTRVMVQPEVGGYGVTPVFVGKVEGGWQVNFKLPPGLAPGWHPVRLRIGDAISNPFQIAVDVPLGAECIDIVAVYDVASWQRSQVSPKGGSAAIWVHGLPGNADMNNIRVDIGGRRQPTVFVGELAENDTTQINVTINPRTPTGDQLLRVQFGDTESAPVQVKVS